MPIHPEGWRFVAIFSLITVLLFALTPVLGFLSSIVTLWCLYFFRNPKKAICEKTNCIVSPADGKIVKIEDVVPPVEFGLDPIAYTRISIFLNIFDIHVNRIPESGVIKKVLYHPGKFFNASLDKASEHNERNVIVMETNQKHTIAFVQIAGLIARRIRCDVREGDHIERGQLYGLIRFGSRVDVYLPKEVDLFVLNGQRTIGGETILAQFEEKAF
jgi:phosphatidylserine decarboxylase